LTKKTVQLDKLFSRRQKVSITLAQVEAKIVKNL